jgi:hypothetical protein
MRRALTLVAPFVLVLAATSPVSAAPPTRESLEPFIAEFETGEVCDFNLRVEVLTVTAKTITFDRRDGVFRQISTGRIIQQATNLDSGASETFRTSGPARFSINEAGHLVLRLGGSSLFIFFEGDVTGRGLLYMTGGGAELEVGDDGFFFSRMALPAHAQDVCALLSAG